MNQKILLSAAAIIAVIAIYKISTSSKKALPITATPTQTQNTDSLQVTVDKYVAANYPKYKIVSNVDDPLCTGEKAIDFGLENTAKERISLIFKPNGTFVQEESDINFTDLPKEVINNTKKDFKSYTYEDKAEKLIMANKEINYLVDLDPNGKPFEVIFNHSGTVVCKTQPH